jgi:hypothetical protein
MTEPGLPYRVYSRDLLLGEASSLKLQKDEIDMTAAFQLAKEANRPLTLQLTELASGSNNVPFIRSIRLESHVLSYSAQPEQPAMI